MVSLHNIHIIGLFYMDRHGGYKPNPEAFVYYIRRHKLKARRLFFFGNRLIDMELADAVKGVLHCEVFKCLIIRGEGSNKSADLVVHNLKEAAAAINKYRPDIVFSDFDNTLAFTGYEFVEEAAETMRFWERHGKNKLLRMINNILSLMVSPFINRRPFTGKNDDTALFLKTLKYPLIIHSMSPEPAIKSFLRRIFIN